MISNQLIFLKEYTHAFKFYYDYLKQDQKQFAGLFIFIFGVAASNTLMIWLLGLPFDYLAKENFEGLGKILIVLFFVIVVNQAFHYFSTFGSNVVALKFVGRVRTSLLQHIMNLPFIITDDMQKGDLLARISHDVDKAQNFVVAFPLFIASHIFTIIFYTCMLVYLDWRLALFALLLSSVYFVHHWLFAEKKRRAAEGFFYSNGDLLAKEDEILTNSRLVSSYNAQNTVHDKHLNLFDVAFRWAKKERKLNALFSTSLAVLIYLCALLIVYQGVHSVEDGSLAISALISFLLYMGYLSVPMRGITELVFEAQSDLMAGKRVKAIFDIEETIHENLPPIKIVEGDIRFENLSCQLGESQIFNNFSVNIPSGKTIAIVGESGAGKSTLANLLLRYINPQKGRVFVDGNDISQFDIQSLRNDVTIVWQLPLIFNDTIRNNLLLAKQNANDDELEAACMQSDTWDFISALPDGLDTLLGSGGVELSAGQKQRLHISQAFLRNSPILIMDEASSALDSQAEEKIVQALKENRKNKTTLLIAHRYSSIRQADLIVYLNGDGTASLGTHEELMHNHKAYQHALQWQMGTS